MFSGKKYDTTSTERQASDLGQGHNDCCGVKPVRKRYNPPITLDNPPPYIMSIWVAHYMSSK